MRLHVVGKNGKDITQCKITQIMEIQGSHNKDDNNNYS